MPKNTLAETISLASEVLSLIKLTKSLSISSILFLDFSRTLRASYSFSYMPINSFSSTKITP